MWLKRPGGWLLALFPGFAIELELEFAISCWILSEAVSVIVKESSVCA